MRQIVLDTETTGIGHEKGHRIIEIGCVELIDRKLTGKHFHAYINPKREVEHGAFKVHGISTEFLQDKPVFKEILSPFIEFVDGCELIIHNAPFDVGFLNAELKRVKWHKTIEKHCRIFDTLQLARKKHPGQRNNLDALCKRYDVDNANRTLHGALLDAEILALVYLAMTGGQASLFFEEDTSSKIPVSTISAQPLSSHAPVLRANAQELEDHQALVDYIIETSGINLWQKSNN